MQLAIFLFILLKFGLNLGKYAYADGSIYIGEWLNDEKNGKGQYQYANGDIYKGEFKDGEKHGFGEYKLLFKNFFVKYTIYWSFFLSFIIILLLNW